MNKFVLNLQAHDNAELQLKSMRADLVESENRITELEFQLDQALEEKTHLEHGANSEELTQQINVLEDQLKTGRKMYHELEEEIETSRHTISTLQVNFLKRLSYKM